MDEQEATDNLEVLCGGRKRAFRLMRLYSAADTASRTRQRFSYVQSQKTHEQVFKQMACDEGYSDAAISAYLEYVA